MLFLLDPVADHQGLEGSLQCRQYELSLPSGFFSGDDELILFLSHSPALFKNCDLMWKQSMWTSTISSHLATKHLKEGGLLTLAGAKAALDGTPGKPSFSMCSV